MLLLFIVNIYYYDQFSICMIDTYFVLVCFHCHELMSHNRQENKLYHETLPPSPPPPPTPTPLTKPYRGWVDFFLIDLLCL